jgi:hypothetical protein
MAGIPIRMAVEVRGEVVRMGLQDLSAEIPKVGRRQIRVVLNRIVSRMRANEPPEPSSYKGRRTGLLNASWGINEAPDGTGYILSNDATKRGNTYPRYVVGNGEGVGQAWMHRGRWPLLRNVVDEELTMLTQEVLENLSVTERRLGFSNDVR